MSPGLVSVIVPVYNEEAFIAEALDSAFAQDYRPFEVIVIDDGSSDRTAEIASRYDVQLVRQLTRGPAAARNAGVELARGDYIASLDGDDIWPADRVSAMVSALERTGAGIVSGLIEYFFTPGEAKPDHFPTEITKPVPGGHVTLLVHRSVYDLVGLFDESMRVGEDTDWFMRARDAGVAFEFVQQVVMRYRIHAGNTSHDIAARRQAALKIFRASIARRRSGAGPHARERER
jgi:glycosyltransferase involved in cell wall biosynthesis